MDYKAKIAELTDEIEYWKDKAKKSMKDRVEAENDGKKQAELQQKAEDCRREGKDREGEFSPT